MTPAPARRAPLAAAGLAILFCLAAGCADEEGPPPDPMLQDSLGLAAGDRVVRVRIAARDGAETVEPSQVELAPGWYLEFFTRDRRLHTVAFLLDSMSLAQAEFLRSTGQDRSPPLIELDSRFVVSFDGAPPGRYPFLVEGNGEAAHGAAVVRAPAND